MSTTRCPCGAAVSAKSLHGLACKLSRGKISRHDALNNDMLQALRTAGASCIREPPGCSRFDGKRPDGQTLVPWRRGRHLIWNASPSSPPTFLELLKQPVMQKLLERPRRKKIRPTIGSLRVHTRDLRIKRDVGQEMLKISLREIPPTLHNEKANWECFKEDLERNIDLKIPLNTSGQIEGAMSTLTKQLQQAAWNATPAITPTNAQTNCPPFLKKKIAEKRNLKELWQNNRTLESKTALDKASKGLKKLMLEIKTTVFKTT
ncbi:hypothetical protein ILUMI_05485 [Ignelater luminosus]|uniref:Uncharacterized protein n=1 Tax=Ignelater luminosus TaxID=2038154 RepID=A0A8K0D770_IGNLU|nr:hypothetical protein ILUMI_05485 [Ignelater luminosus]